MIQGEHRRKAEKAARVYLQMRGYKLLEQNWSLGRSRLDAIAKKDGIIYFIDLSYNPGLESRAPTFDSQQHKQRRNAVDAWLDENKWDGKYKLSTIELIGPDFAVAGFSDDLI